MKTECKHRGTEYLMDLPVEDCPQGGNVPHFGGFPQFSPVAGDGHQVCCQDRTETERA
jgi:hypothetical protein